MYEKEVKMNTKKKNYNNYFMKGEESFRVCKSFYLSTLAVSQRMIYNAHQNKDKVTDIIKPDDRGKHAADPAVPRRT